MKLHELKKGDKLLLETENGNEVFIFDHVDGMYSFNYAEQDPKKIIHLSVMTPLEKDATYYKIKK